MLIMVCQYLYWPIKKSKCFCHYTATEFFQINNLLSLIFESLHSLLTKLHIVDFSHLTVFNTRHASITAGLTHLFCNTAQGMGVKR